MEEKAPFADDMWGALPGAPGLEALLPLLLTAVADGRLTWSRLAEVTSGNAARIFGLGGEGRAAGRRGRGRRGRRPGPVVDDRHGALADAVARDGRDLARPRGDRGAGGDVSCVAGSWPATGSSTGRRGWGRLVRPG